MEQLKGYFETLYEGEVSSVACPKNTGKLRKLLKKRQAKAWQVEHVRAVIAQKGQRPKARKGGFCCFGGTKMDAEELREAELAEFNTLSTDMLKAINAHADYLPGGVVAFHKRETATHAAQVTLRLFTQSNPTAGRPFTTPCDHGRHSSPTTPRDLLA